MKLVEARSPQRPMVSLLIDLLKDPLRSGPNSLFSFFSSLYITITLALFHLFKYAVLISPAELFHIQCIFLEFSYSSSIAFQSLSWNVTSLALCYTCYSMTFVLILLFIPLTNVQCHTFSLHFHFIRQQPCLSYSV